MEFIGTSENEFVDILLSAAHRGDVNSLENHLSAVVNPNLYLNRVYDEASMQKCTLLMIACLKRHADVIRTLLRRFKPDLEVLNDIIFEDVNPSQQLFSNVSVLWVAASVNNFEIVKLLVEHGANVNHTTKTNSTPLRGACYSGNVDMARYLIDNGADININKENNDTNLMVSVYHKHLNVVTYLVDELRCDVNVCDDYGRSSLYDAVNCGSLELVEFLLQRGARNFRAIGDQISPLMLATEKRRTDLVDVISPYCSLLERIEAEELLGSAFVCGHRGDRALDQSFKHFHQALELRSSHDLPKILKLTTDEIFDHRQECETVDQLKEIRLNFDRMYIEGLLVRERLLGPTNAEYRYSLCYRGAILADNRQHHRAVDYWMYELGLCQQYSIPLDPKHLRHFASLFSGMVLKSMAIPMKTLLKIITATTEELEHAKKNCNYNLYTLLFLITITSQLTAFMSTTDLKAFYRDLHSINQRQYTTYDCALSLLHLSLDNHTSVDDYHISRICKYPCLQTARLLIQCGANVNAIDAVRNTPLHIVAINDKSTFDESILKLLCDAGAHLDYANALGETPVDVASNLNIKRLLKSKTKLSLKCLCARLIQKKNVPFRERIAVSLVNFVEKH